MGGPPALEAAEGLGSHTDRIVSGFERLSVHELILSDLDIDGDGFSRAGDQRPSGCW